MTLEGARMRAEIKEQIQNCLNFNMVTDTAVEKIIKLVKRELIKGLNYDK